MARILLIDIETSPIMGLSWNLRETDIAHKIKSTEILSFAYQWLDGKTQVIARDNQSEKSLLKKIHKLLDEADIVIAQNGDAFDIKKINARFIFHKFNPPSPYKTIDTLKISRSVSSFDSHSLENISQDLGEGEKIKHRGVLMWWGCMRGNKKDWRDMKRYNARDVDQLKKIYLRFRPWAKNHPDIRPALNGSCPKCQSTKIQKRGTFRNKRQIMVRLQCMRCGGWDSKKLENI